LIGFYENEKFQARLAYNWRDDFYTGGTGASSGTPGPNNIEAYGQWDMSASYDVNDNLTVFIEGINLTEETTRSYGRSTAQVIRAGQTGARYNFGVRYNF
jgi:outer membrane receptor protein involved in Fe transport